MSGISLRSTFEEAFEDEAVLQRVYLGDLEAVEDEAGGGAAADGGQDAMAVDELEQVPDDEEVVGEVGLLDYVEFVLQSSQHLGRRIRYPAAQTFLTQLTQVTHRRHARGDGIMRQQGGAKVDLHLARLGDAEGVPYRLGRLLPQGRHLGGGFEVVRGVRHVQAFGIVDVRIGLDARQHA